MSHVFDYFKDRRYVPLFFITLSVLAVVMVLMKDLSIEVQMAYVLPGIGVLLMAVVVREIRRIRAERRNRYKSSPLSRDERSKARSKLYNNTNPVKRSAPRAPDIDLKY